MSVPATLRAAPLVWQSLDLRVVSALPPALDAELREFWATGVGLPGREVRLTTQPPPSPPAGLTRRRLALMDIELEVGVAGDEMWLGDGLWARVAPSGGEVRCVPGAASPEAWALVFTELHRAGGWLPLHAAVIAAGVRAVAFTGVSGAGKSTAALRLYAAGERVVAEDRAFWHAQSGEVMGLDRTLRTYDDSLERFAPELLPHARALGRDRHGKLRLELKMDNAPAARLVRLLLLRSVVSGEELTPAERVRTVWEATGVPLTATARVQVQHGILRLLASLWPQPLGREEIEPAVRVLLTAPAES